ncbi:hypothetical protein BH09MYX1_BH09MYX1_59640 [soil metagenome]
MGTQTGKPTWWTSANHDSAWERAKEALKRDWTQTKRDFDMKGGRDLDQDVDDTLKQAAGTDVVPPANVANVPGGTPQPTPEKSDKKHTHARPWEDVEAPMRYGVGARAEYKKPWTEMEHTLRGEWEQFSVGETWEDVKHEVRRGYDHGAKT